MKRLLIVIIAWALNASSIAQNISLKIANAYRQFEADSQLRHATISFYVINAKTGDVVFDKNSQTGLAPASTQKIITAVTAFELLGRSYRYKTELGYDGVIEKDTLKGNLYFKGTGDPTLGSWRYWSTKPDSILKLFYSSIAKAKISWMEGSLYIDEKKFETQTIPNGWIWEDIGNYYGAGTGAINWRENQYDLFLKSGKNEGDRVRFVNGKKNRELASVMFNGDSFNELKTGKPGTGDNAYLYFYPGSSSKYYRGTIPPGEDSFKISAAIYSSSWYFYQEFNAKKSFHVDGDMARDFASFESLQKYGGNKEILREKKAYSLDEYTITNVSKYDPYVKPVSTLSEYYSPTLDSIIYWFLQKSINLYGEALIKTFAYEKKGFGATDSGVAIVKDFWKQKGLDVGELNIMDGSGLSPQNRVTTHAQVEILKYAKTKDWFPYFYDALPTYNGMKMKSGSIRDVKGYCGYQKATDGKEYIFSFLINNYNGSSSGVVNKMYAVLNVLK